MKVGLVIVLLNIVLCSIHCIIMHAVEVFWVVLYRVSMIDNLYILQIFKYSPRACGMESTLGCMVDGESSWPLLTHIFISLLLSPCIACHP